MIAIKTNVVKNYYTSFSREWKQEFENHISKSTDTLEKIEVCFMHWLDFTKIKNSFERIETVHANVNGNLKSVVTDPLFEITSGDLKRIDNFNSVGWHDMFSAIVYQLVERLEIATPDSHQKCHDFLKTTRTPIFYIHDIYIDREFASMCYCQYFVDR